MRAAFVSFGLLALVGLFRTADAQVCTPPSCNGYSDRVYLTGNVPTCLYEVFNKDVYIYDVQVVAGSGSTLTVRVHNGSIFVGEDCANAAHNDGIIASGSHGFDASGGNCSDTAGGGGGSPFHVVLETLPPGVGITPRTMDITITREIMGAGGNGGSGANGCSETQYSCPGGTYTLAGDGGTAGAGAAGASVTILATGNITISNVISVNGGRGGAGGWAGQGYLGPAGDAQEGGAGGNGGTISVQHTAAAPANANCSISMGVAEQHAGALTAAGGGGGDGGGGATGSHASPGGNGGDAGTGGSITLNVKNLNLSASSGVARCLTEGGSGGLGGDGGHGHQTSCIDCIHPYPDRLVPWGAAGASGMGGDGGAGGPISIAVAGHFHFGGYAALSANGGNGAIAGQSGNGAIEGYGGCTPTTCNLWIPHAGGEARGSGRGGNGGNITVSTYWYYTGATSTMNVTGGVGAAGRAAGNGEGFCCGGAVVETAGAQGGTGGPGGNGATISLTYSKLTGTPQGFSYCGGLGGQGGNGGCGRPGGAGGFGGGGGLGGEVYINSSLVSSACGVGAAIPGAVGPVCLVCPPID